VYLEALVPLVAAHNKLSAVRELDLQVSVRGDRYATKGLLNPSSGGLIFLSSPEGPFPAVNYTQAENTSKVSTIGLRYLPLPDVVLRASFATGFLPPNMSQIVSRERDMNCGFYGYDPKRNNRFVYYSTACRSAGNPDLRPERSRSWALGGVFTPRFLPGLRLSLDYTRIDKTDEINYISTQDMLNDEKHLGYRFTRAPLTDSDIANGYTGGVVTYFDESLANIARTKVRALDIQLDYSFSVAHFGELNAYAVLSRQTQLTRKVLPTSVPVNEVGYTNGPLEWNGNMGLSLERGAWSAAWMTQYIGAHFVYANGNSPEGIAAETQAYGRSRFGDQFFHDLSVRYRFAAVPGFAHGLLSNADILVGIQNVFNTSPRITPTTYPDGGYEYRADPRMRRYTVSFTKNF
jgi:outer membrane receptor protein involved in Fe transport